jgi:CrcB protein
MNQIIAVALGGAFGSVFRFLISTGVYQWMGRGFPYGTLTVNVIGSFLIGLMTEALLLQRVALSVEYRSAILIGLFGSLTTFSTFSLDTLYLIEQGQLSKASVNIILNVVICVLVVWIGLVVGRALFSHSGGTIRWMGWVYPYALLAVNLLGAFLIGGFSSLLISKTQISIEHSAAISIIVVGVFFTLSCLYLVLYFIEHGYAIETHLKSISVALISNVVVCSFALWLGVLVGKQI